jgi:hypothetical protein
MIKMHPSAQLEVVGSTDGIVPAFENLVSTPLPGFQISPDVSTEDSLAILRQAMQQYNPGFEFDDIFGQQDIGTTHAHLDGGYAGRMAGLTLHENIHGLGKVTLQLVKPDVTETSQMKKRSLVSPCMSGELMPGMKTVFSNRIYDVHEKRVLAGATYHLFEIADSSSARSWRRYTSSQVLGF